MIISGGATPSARSDPPGADTCGAGSKALSGINRSICIVCWPYCVVPLTMEFGPADVDVVHVLVGYGDAFGIEVGVEFAADRQAGVGRGGADQIDDDAIADQRLGTPVHADERERSE